MIVASLKLPVFPKGAGALLHFSEEIPDVIQQQRMLSHFQQRLDP